MTAFVLDASVTMAWCFDEECDAYADSALDALMKQSAWDVTLALGRQLGLSSYNASYVGLAQQLGAPLATRGKQVRTACEHIGIDLWNR